MRSYESKYFKRRIESAEQLTPSTVLVDCHKCTELHKRRVIVDNNVKVNRRVTRVK